MYRGKLHYHDDVMAKLAVVIFGEASLGDDLVKGFG